MKILLLLVYFLLTQTMLYSVEILGIPDAVNIAGKQRMYSQKMLKDYAMIGMHNTFGNPKEDLVKTVKNFSIGLEALTLFTNNKNIKKSLATVKEIWLPIKEKLKDDPSIDEIVALEKSLTGLLKAADAATKLFEKESEKQSNKIINMSGKQRMLSQKMAALYMIKVWGVKDTKFKEKLELAMQEFESALQTLHTSSLNTDQITLALENVEKSFLFFKIMNKSKTKYIPTLIYKKSNDILKLMNDITVQYVMLEKK